MDKQPSDSTESKSRANGTWTYLGWTIVLIIFISYVGSYYYLSRRGMAEAAKAGMDGFLYVPLTDVLATKDLSRHHLLSSLYTPLNMVDQKFFGGTYPIRGILFDMSSNTRAANTVPPAIFLSQTSN